MITKNKIALTAILLIASMAWLRPLTKEVSAPAKSPLLNQGRSKSSVTTNRNPSSKDENEENSPGKMKTLPPPVATSSTYKKISELKICLETQKCEFPQTDPRSYDFAVFKKWSEFLVHAKNDNTLSEEERALIARESMLSGDGFVQSEALKILEDLPISSDNLQSLIEGLELNNSDPLILEKASRELQRYLESADEPSVHQYLFKTIVHGGHFMSEQASIITKDFINPRSIEIYRDAASKIASTSQKAKFLRTALQDYELQKNGG